MKRIGLISAALLVIFVIVRGLGLNGVAGLYAKLDGGETLPSVGGGSSSSLPARTRKELRIDITRSADQAQKEHAQIMARYSGDREASQWVRACAQQGLGTGEDAAGGDLSIEMERVCWQQYSAERP